MKMVKAPWLFLDVKTDEGGNNYFVWPRAPRSRVFGGDIRGGTIWGGDIRGGDIWGGDIRGGTIWGGDIEYIISHLQYQITINLTCDSAQIGCHYKTIQEWLSVSLEDAREMGLKEKNYEPIRNLLKKFAK